MRKFKSFISTLALSCFMALVLTACITTGTTSEREGLKANQVEVNALENGMNDLTLYLRRVAGVQVSGEGADAEIIIRGVNSINAAVSPLFVVDGNNFGRDYSRVYSMVNVEQVKRVTVLKSAVDIGIYGVQGSNGVIEIEMKH